MQDIRKWVESVLVEPSERGREFLFQCWCGEWGVALIEMELFNGKYGSHCTVQNIR